MNAVPRYPGYQTPEGLFQGLIRGPHLWRVWPLAKAMKTFRLGRTRPLQRANYLGTGKKRGKKSWLEFQRKKSYDPQTRSGRSQTSSISASSLPLKELFIPPGQTWWMEERKRTSSKTRSCSLSLFGNGISSFLQNDIFLNFKSNMIARALKPPSQFWTIAFQVLSFDLMFV